MMKKFYLLQKTVFLLLVSNSVYAPRSSLSLDNSSSSGSQVDDLSGPLGANISSGADGGDFLGDDEELCLENKAAEILQQELENLNIAITGTNQLLDKTLNQGDIQASRDSCMQHVGLDMFLQELERLEELRIEAITSLANCAKAQAAMDDSLRQLLHSQKGVLSPVVLHALKLMRQEALLIARKIKRYIQNIQRNRIEQTNQACCSAEWQAARAESTKQDQTQEDQTQREFRAYDDTDSSSSDESSYLSDEAYDVSESNLQQASSSTSTTSATAVPLRTEQVPRDDSESKQSCNDSPWWWQQLGQWWAGSKSEKQQKETLQAQRLAKTQERLKQEKRARRVAEKQIKQRARKDREEKIRQDARKDVVQEKMVEGFKHDKALMENKQIVDRAEIVQAEAVSWEVLQREERVARECRNHNVAIARAFEAAAQERRKHEDDIARACREHEEAIAQECRKRDAEERKHKRECDQKEKLRIEEELWHIRIEAQLKWERDREQADNKRDREWNAKITAEMQAERVRVERQIRLEHERAVALAQLQHAQEMAHALWEREQAKIIHENEVAFIKRMQLLELKDRDLELQVYQKECNRELQAHIREIALQKETHKQEIARRDGEFSSLKEKVKKERNGELIGRFVEVGVTLASVIISKKWPTKF